MQSSPKRSESAATTTRPGAVLGDREQRRARRRRRRRAARQHARAVAQLEPAGAVEARAAHAGEQVDAVARAVARARRAPSAARAS